MHPVRLLDAVASLVIWILIAGSLQAYAAQEEGPTGTQTPKPIGQKPEDETDIRKIFLRQSTVLLRPGQVEIEAGPEYTRNQVSSPILNAKLRQFRMPLSARIGLFNRAEMYMTVPAVYARQEFAFAESAVANGEFGLGDVSAGLNLEIARETARWPDVIGFVALSAPTGSKPKETALSLGSGHWELGFGAQFIRTVDPVALFAGVYYAHAFPARYFVNDAVQSVDPGETAGYNFGFGFAVNEDISLSAQITGSYQSNARASGKDIFGSSREPVSLRSALTYRCSPKIYLEPSVTIGLDDETADFALGISLTRRFGK
ncbi:MAG: transporter [Acidobacteriota bacterium]|nr:transporter [Acidobacteriota bacterium]